MNSWHTLLPTLEKLRLALLPVLFATVGLLPLSNAASPDAPLPIPWLAPLGKPLDEASSLEALVERMRDRDLVLLGESTHGTHEYYVWRDRISRRLIETGKFRFIAVEGDWATLLPLNRYVKGKPDAPGSAREALERLERWPTWMWANVEIEALAEWLRSWNADRPMADRVGFYGKDVYAPWDAADYVAEFASRHLGEEKHLRALRTLARFLGHRDNIQGYVRAAYTQRSEAAENFGLLRDLIDQAENVSAFERFTARQSAYVVKGAHNHFMGMVDRGPESWNARVHHMKGTVGRLMEFYGPDAKGIVWAHNTHIGDARATAMGARGEVNIGQLAREQRGADAVFALGFTTHRGTVLAGRQWAGPRQTMQIPEGVPGSLEAALNAHFPEGALLIFDEAPAEALRETVPHRAIGVVYRPEAEAGNYVPTRLAARYDAMLFLPETKALKPLN